MSMKTPIFILYSCFVCVLLGYSTSSFSQIYKWTDSKGKVHFSDTPPKEQADHQSKTETVNVDTSARGTVFAPKDKVQQWHEQKPKDSKPIARQTDSSPTQISCNKDFINCFKKEDDEVCKLRYGTSCTQIHTWKACYDQKCERNSCKQTFKKLRNRPVSLNSRDLGRTLPIKSLVSKQDWECLKKSGFYCHELANEKSCQENFYMSCKDLENWKELAIERCDKLENKLCKKPEQYLKYRPIDLEERHRSGHYGSYGRKLIKDKLVESLIEDSADKTEEDIAFKETIKKFPGENKTSVFGKLNCKDDLIIPEGAELKSK